MDTTVLVAVQAIATAVSAASAAGLAWLTVRRDRDARAERERDLAREQRRAIVAALGRLHKVFTDRDAYEPDFELARAELATALELGMVRLPAADLILADDMPKPPYAIGQTEHWNRLEAALAEFLERARRSPEEVDNSNSTRRR